MRSRSVPGAEEANAARLSVVVPTTGLRPHLITTVPLLLEDPAVSQVVVVVDGRRDRLGQWLEAMADRDRRVVAVHRGEPGGAQVARAAGLERATGDVVLFLDDDVVPGPGLAGGHLRRHATGAGRVVVGYMPVVLPPTRRPGQFATVLYAGEYESRCQAYERDPDEILRTLWWGNVSLRRSDVTAVGLVSAGFESAYHEDQDFGLRCRERGLRGVFDRTLVAAHHHARSADGFVRDARSQGYGRALVARRHPAMAPALGADAFEGGLPRWAAAVVRAARRPNVARVTEASLTAAVRACGAARAYGLELAAARLLRRVGQQAGAEAARRGEPLDPGHRVEPSRAGVLAALLPLVAAVSLVSLAALLVSSHG